MILAINLLLKRGQRYALLLHTRLARGDVRAWSWKPTRLNASNSVRRNLGPNSSDSGAASILLRTSYSYAWGGLANGRHYLLLLGHAYKGERVLWRVIRILSVSFSLTPLSAIAKYFGSYARRAFTPCLFSRCKCPWVSVHFGSICFQRSER